MLRTSDLEDDSCFGWEDSFIPWKFFQREIHLNYGEWSRSELRIGRCKTLIIFEAVKNTGSYSYAWVPWKIGDQVLPRIASSEVRISLRYPKFVYWTLRNGKTLTQFWNSTKDNRFPGTIIKWINSRWASCSILGHRFDSDVYSEREDGESGPIRFFGMPYYYSP